MALLVKLRAPASGRLDIYLDCSAEAVFILTSNPALINPAYWRNSCLFMVAENY